MGRGLMQRYDVLPERVSSGVWKSPGPGPRHPLFPRLLLVGALLLPLPAAAVLGESEVTIPTDARTMGMDVTGTVEDRTGYRVHEMTDARRGVRVHQYAIANGKVFGVSWDGPVRPDLHQLLGRYFVQYGTARTSGNPAAGGPIVHLPDLEVRFYGHMRHFWGRAWVPSLVPATVDSDAIR